MPARFVILHHTGYGCEHWDLMIEHGDALLTWQLHRELTGPDALPIPATRIGEHRKHYLNYEGPVSRDRGRVRRIESGTVEINEITASACRFVADSERLCGLLSLSRLEGGQWVLDACTDPNAT